MKNHTPPHTLAPPLAQPVYTSLLRWLVLSLLAVVYAAGISQAGVVTGVTVTANSTFPGTEYAASNLVNGDVATGAAATPLSGAFGSFVATHDNHADSYGMWTSGLSDGSPSVLTFNLGGIYNLSNIYIWQGNQIADNGSGDATGRGVNQFDILVSSDGINFSPVTTDANLTQSPSPGAPVSAQQFALVQTAITHVRINIDSTHGIPNAQLSEVMFDGVICAPPTLTTTVNTPTVTTTTATPVGGNVSSQGGASLSARGVVYMVGGPTATPTLTNSVAVEGATTTGVFTVGLSSLLTGTQYAYRAYATNAGGTSYGAVRNFTTVTAKPELSLDDYDPSPTSVILNAEVTHAGGLAITARGFVYSATVSVGADLTIGGSNTQTVADTIGSGEGIAGVFSVERTGLLPGTTYNYVAYARNSRGVTYTSMSTFTTSGLPPTVTTPTKTEILGTTATLGGFVSKTNGSAITARGVVYSSTDITPTIEEDADFADASTSSTGIFTVDVTGLSPATLYYFSAYAENDDGNGYSAVSSFTTLAAAPSVTTGTAGTPTSTAVAVNGNAVVSANGATVTERGIVVSLSSVSLAPTVGVAGHKSFAHPTDAVGSYNVSATGLLPFSTYSYRAYAINSRGTSYGVARTFRTAVGAPTVNAPSVTKLSATTVTLGGTVVRVNGDAVDEYGVEVYQGGELIDTVSAAGPKLGVFTVNVTGLLPATAYTFKAYATNGGGTGRSTIGVAPSTLGRFTTLASKPSVTTVSGSETGLIRGLVTDANGSAVTKYGVAYSTADTTPTIGEPNVLYKSVTTDAVITSFSVNVTLKAGKRYYYRAYAINGKGTGYGDVESLVTADDAPTVTATTPSDANIAKTSASIGGRIVSDNGEAITARGVRYWKTSTPSDKITKKAVGTALGGFAVAVTGLTANTSYTFQAYATNSIDTAYSSSVTFTTDAVVTTLAEASAGAASSGTAETCYTTDAATGLKYLTIVISDASQAPTVEVSGNLTDWFSGSSHTTVISDAAGILKVRDNTPVTADSKRYIRVRP